MNKVLRFVVNEILYNGHLQALGSLSIVIFSSLMFKIKITWDLLVILYLTFYLILLYNRYGEISIDYIDNKTRTEHLKMFYKYIPVVMIGILLILIALLFYFANLKFIIFIIAIVILGIAYTHYFKSLTKKIFLFKDYYVSLFFTSLLLSPFFYYSLPIKSVLNSVIALIIFAFLRDMRMQFVLDLKDIESDKAMGLRTLGVLYGKDKTLNVLKLSSIITAGFIPLLIFFFFNFPASILILCLLIILDFYIIDLIRRGNFLAYILESGEFILWTLLIFIGDKLL